MQLEAPGPSLVSTVLPHWRIEFDPYVFKRSPSWPGPGLVGRRVEPVWRRRSQKSTRCLTGAGRGGRASVGAGAGRGGRASWKPYQSRSVDPEPAEIAEPEPIDAALAPPPSNPNRWRRSGAEPEPAAETRPRAPGSKLRRAWWSTLAPTKSRPRPDPSRPSRGNRPGRDAPVRRTRQGSSRSRSSRIRRNKGAPHARVRGGPGRHRDHPSHLQRVRLHLDRRQRDRRRLIQSEPRRLPPAFGSHENDLIATTTPRASHIAIVTTARATGTGDPGWD